MGSVINSEIMITASNKYLVNGAMGKLVKSFRLGRKVLPVRVRVAPPSYRNRKRRPGPGSCLKVH